MNLSSLTKSIPNIASILGFVTISNLLLINSVDAFSVTFSNGDSNGGFESTNDGESTGTGLPNNWSTIGDVFTTGVIDGISPTSGSNQAIITTGYIEGNYGAPIGNRNDDSSRVFNQSGTNPVSADTNPNADFLQEHLGLSSDALSIERSAGVHSSFGPRTSKEGSGMYRDITIEISPDDVSNGTDGFTVSFNWAYLTNDGKSDDFGNQDFSFVSIDDQTNPVAIEVLGDSNQTISSPTADNDFFDGNTISYTTYTQSFTGLGVGPHNYRVGLGVVDVDSYDRSSALLVDNFNVQQVPFEFSPTAGIALMLGLFGCDRLRRRLRQDIESN